MKEEPNSQTSDVTMGPQPSSREMESQRLSSAATVARSQPEGKSHASSEATEEWSAEQKEFASLVHQYLRDFIKFADQKAAFIFAVASATFAFLVKQGAYKSLLIPIAGRGFPEWAAFLSCLLVGFAGLFSLLVVLPRLRGQGDGLIYWKGIVKSGDVSNYLSRIQQFRDGQLTNVVLKHCYELAQIADRKYELLKWAMWFGAFGAIATGCVLLGL
jgi:Family of unknown function (DUF5706)